MALRMRKLGDDYISIKENEVVMDRYSNFFKDSQIKRKLKVDTSKPLEETLNKIQNYVYGELERLRGDTKPDRQLKLF